MPLAPIVLFVYNRPKHTLRTLEALAQNALSGESVLFIFCDGAKALATKEERNAIAEVRKIVRSKQWCKEVHIVERHENWGLANSIMAGVTSIIRKYGKVIVLEDDILTSRGFLTFMNQALDLYEHESSVMHVSGYLPPVSSSLPTTFFLRLATCWGWATWKRAWEKFNPNPHDHLDFLMKNHLLDTFDLDGANPFSAQLIANAEGTLYTWAIKWYASIFRESGLSLHPYPSLTQNFGNDGSGQSTDARAAHFSWSSLAENISPAPIPLEESLQARKAVAEFYKKLHQSGTYLKSPWLKKIKRYFPSPLEQKIKYMLIPSYRRAEQQKNKHQLWKKHLQTLPRYEKKYIDFLDKKLLINDGVSFLSEYEFVFEKEKLKFQSPTMYPSIFLSQDRIGLKTLFFRTLYPKSNIHLHCKTQNDFLLHNLKSYAIDNVNFIDFNHTTISDEIELIALDESIPQETLMRWITVAKNVFYETSFGNTLPIVCKILSEHGFSLEVEPHRKVFSSLWMSPFLQFPFVGCVW
ncbi:MAG: hypothetical protein NZ521_06830, partial [Flammeovirgaceae bacterium]|nr:hypothetical protein [Flammeovirgaceae bacterium]MDW8287957.1 hypothetical protein [Flammeovirgaceae bacterium]